MSHDPYKIALSQIAALREKWRCHSVMTSHGEASGILLGFALDSETLEPQAIMEARDLQLCASPVPDLDVTGASRTPREDHFARDRLRVLRHRKGGLYTRVGIVTRGDEEFVLCVSHHDGTWWIRPRGMFEDGRFQDEDGAVPSLVASQP